MWKNQTAQRTPRLALVCTAGLVVSVLAGCSGGTTGTPSMPEVPPTPVGSGAPGSAESAGLDSLVAAGELAMKEVPGSTVITIETEQNGAVWEVQVVTSDGTENQLDISADGTEVVSGPRAESDDAADKAKHQQRVAAAKIDYKKAAELMLDAVPGGSIQELGLDSDMGKTVWEGDVIDTSQFKHEVQLDAVDGKVLRDDSSD
ncbi:PepSY domain-containing protein [Microbacterium sp. KUDC0406]|uniref:PepSY domain-containing protein n=1 Tax=Microbacterium sp. KUDC0406 TaxID=2909588 RepID=UPI001F402BD5|nr:PepSY domain-containing protein [Microbacterium sp. KUDC0406]UJP09139.1 PepSY domain-containing protein [Microbacterium sp. KUDC0406]